MIKSLLAIFLFNFLSFFGYSQGHYNNENFGNRSLLLSGNVTGSVDDLGLAYYNPGRISLVENPVFSINAKAYQLNFVDLQNAFGQDEKLSDSRFQGVPSMLAGTFNVDKWKDHHFAYSFFTRNRNRVDIGLTKEEEVGLIVDGDLEKVTTDIKLRKRESEEWFGVTWGTKIAENLGVGVSAFISIYDFSNFYDITLAGLEDSGEVNLINNELKADQYSYGMFWKIGLAWKLEKFDLGLNIDLPYLEVISSGSFKYQKYHALATGSEDDVYEFIQYKNLNASRKIPLAVSMGAGFPLGEHKLHFKASWHSKVSAYDRLVIPNDEDISDALVFTEELDPVFNFGVGGEFKLNEKLNLFGSFATDFSPVIKNSNFISNNTDNNIEVLPESDYFHYGLGVEMILKRAHLILGTTYTSGVSSFEQFSEIPEPDLVAANNNETTIRNSRLRFIIGFEIPLFGYEVEFK